MPDILTSFGGEGSGGVLFYVQGKIKRQGRRN